jgi:hypothetical protein
VKLSDGEMVPIYLESGFSTLLKFSAHPEPGLIGDQDGFKVEYMKNIVAIKPLVTKGRTNLFIFTKDGEFNFQLIASRGQHDNVVYVESKPDRSVPQALTSKVAIPIDELLTKRINKTATSKNLRLYLESISAPVSRTALVVKFSLQERVLKTGEFMLRPQTDWFSVAQRERPIKIENIFIEYKRDSAFLSQTTGIILIRLSDLKKSENLRLIFTPPKSHVGKMDLPLQVTFLPDVSRR